MMMDGTKRDWPISDKSTKLLGKRYIYPVEVNTQKSSVGPMAHPALSIAQLAVYLNEYITRPKR